MSDRTSKNFTLSASCVTANLDQKTGDFMRGLAADVDAADALAAAAGAGPYFALEPWAEGAGWRPASLLVADPALLADRVTHARAIIAGRAGIAPAEVAERVAASIVFLGLAARLVSPSLGAAVIGGVVPYLTLDNLWWRPVDGGPVPLAAGPVTGREIGDATAGGQLDDVAALLSERCVQGMAGPVADAFQALFPALASGVAGQYRVRADGRRRDAGQELPGPG